MGDPGNDKLSFTKATQIIHLWRIKSIQMSFIMNIASVVHSLVCYLGSNIHPLSQYSYSNRVFHGDPKQTLFSLLSANTVPWGLSKQSLLFTLLFKDFTAWLKRLGYTLEQNQLPTCFLEWYVIFFIVILLSLFSHLS